MQGGEDLRCNLGFGGSLGRSFIAVGDDLSTTVGVAKTSVGVAEAIVGSAETVVGVSEAIVGVAKPMECWLLCTACLLSTGTCAVCPFKTLRCEVGVGFALPSTNLPSTNLPSTNLPSTNLPSSSSSPFPNPLLSTKELLRVKSGEHVLIGEPW